MSQTSRSETNPSLPRWWLSLDGDADGPHSYAYIVACLKAGQINPSALACPEGSQQWKTLQEWPQFTAVLPKPAEAYNEPPLHFGGKEQADKASPANRRLPNMAHWICVYCIYVVPILFVVVWITSFASDPMFHENSRYRVTEMNWSVFSFLSDLASVILMVVGGLRLRVFKRLGPALIKIGIGLHLAVGVISVVVFVAMSNAASQTDFVPDDADPGPIIVLMLLMFPLLLGVLVFEIVSLIWLIRHDKELPLRQ